jgi:hypothetical protein
MDNSVQPYCPVTLKIETKGRKPEDSDWQNECHQLYMQIKKTMDVGTIEPLRVKAEGRTYRGDILELFNSITAGIASVGGLSVLIDVVKLWLEHRKGTEVTLKFPDGSEMKITRASKEEILNLYEKQTAKQSS